MRNNAKGIGRSKIKPHEGIRAVAGEKLLKGLVELSKTYSFSIQELAGASHSKNSEHYKGKAVDINKLNGIHAGINHPDAKAFIKSAAELGLISNNEWKGTHFHLSVK